MRKALNTWRSAKALRQMGRYLREAPLRAAKPGTSETKQRKKAKKIVLRPEEFERDYPALLITLASTIRTGQDPLRALCESDQLFPEHSTMRAVIKEFQESLESGKSEKDAISEFGKNIAHPDLPMFRLAFTLAIAEGASLAPSLQRLAKSTRQRQSFRRKIRSSLAMQRLSAWGIFACAMFLIGFQFLTQPESLRLIQEQIIGSLSMGVGLSLLVCGLVWMFRIARLNV